MDEHTWGTGRCWGWGACGLRGSLWRLLRGLEHEFSSETPREGKGDGGGDRGACEHHRRAFDPAEDGASRDGEDEGGGNGDHLGHTVEAAGGGGAGGAARAAGKAAGRGGGSGAVVGGAAVRAWRKIMSAAKTT